MTLTQIYLPVTLTSRDGTTRRLVQITKPDGAFCGWADGAEKYDYPGEWEIDAAWAPEQAAMLARYIQDLRASGVAVRVTESGIARHVTSIV